MKGEHIVKDKSGDSSHDFQRIKGLEIKCSRCGKELPLLHPHIIVERSDELGNLICEECYFSEDTK